MNELSNSRERISIRENGLPHSREQGAIRENELSNSRERITNPWERITNPWERIAQFDITIYVWLFLKIPMSLQGFRINLYAHIICLPRCFQLCDFFSCCQPILHNNLMNIINIDVTLFNNVSKDYIFADVYSEELISSRRNHCACTDRRHRRMNLTFNSQKMFPICVLFEWIQTIIY